VTSNDNDVIIEMEWTDELEDKLNEKAAKIPAHYLQTYSGMCHVQHLTHWL